MKPGEVKRRFADRVNTVEDLQLALAKVLMISNQNPCVINVGDTDPDEGPGHRFMLELEEECLTDGSTVWNVLLGYSNRCQLSAPGPSPRT